MSNDEQVIEIDYYSDVLCVWAWIAQPRLNELYRQWGDRLRLRHRFVDIFGDARQKIPDSWGQDDGFRKFHEHVAHSATPFDESEIHPDIWTVCRPRSSMQPHLLLRAVGLAAGEKAMENMALRIRQAFFCEGKDIGQMQLLLELAAEQALDASELRQHLEDGSALAALSSDLRSANQLGVRGSPTWILNNGRQVLYGNVGYRILASNIEELLRHPGDDASWC